ncbi:hypothetical protein [Streptomyces europaeiscabiei]|uniref:hypothetical protein n=1 Tax=Streptomyces europaeiscabiei TaxID=146819 RepID=UPI0029BA474D|nr:hypothetical protein [Streptomyces europaeiscabiei]MDX3775917.1 hypothetical protein [Streptomyces europaeiscabiei]
MRSDEKSTYYDSADYQPFPTGLREIVIAATAVVHERLALESVLLFNGRVSCAKAARVGLHVSLKRRLCPVAPGASLPVWVVLGGTACAARVILLLCVLLPLLGEPISAWFSVQVAVLLEKLVHLASR